jgi:hypothetical protein
MTILELKAKCYDIIAQLEYLQAELKKTNDEIAQKLNQEQNANGETVS